MLADLPGEFGLVVQGVEVTVWFVLAGVLLTFSGVGLSMWWNRGPALAAGRDVGAPPAAASPSRRP